VYRFIITALLVSFIPAQPAHAASIPPEMLVITPAKLAEEEGLTTRMVTVIRRDEIERVGADFLDDLLRRIGALQVLREGGPGGNSRLMVRGMDPVHSVILIDGVRAQSTFDGYLDLSGISVHDIERIEISRGAHSVAYGSQAIGGVVNIITRKGGGSFSVDLAYGEGPNGTKSPSVTVSGGKSFLYRMSASAPESEGISSVKGGAEADGYEATTYSGNLAMPMGKGGSLEVIARRDRMDLSLDRDPSLPLADDPVYMQERDRKLVMTRFIYSTSANIMQTLTASEWEETLLRRDSAMYNSATSRVRSAGYQVDVYEAEGGIGIVGLDHREETAELYNGATGSLSNTVSISTGYLNLKTVDGTHTFLYGIRQTEHEILGDYTTYSISALQQDEGSALKYRAGYATGLRLPTAFELEIGGGAALRPELSKSWEMGFEKGFGNGRTFGLLYFDQELRDLIEKDGFTGLPVNRGEASVNGVECRIDSRAPGALSWSLAYTWLETEDADTLEPLPLRPEDRVDLRVAYAGGIVALQVDYAYVGKRPGLIAGTVLESYDMLNVGASIGLGKTFSLFGRVDNALDEEYEDMSGYSAPGREYYAGLRGKF